MLYYKPQSLNPIKHPKMPNEYPWTVSYIKTEDIELEITETDYQTLINSISLVEYEQALIDEGSVGQLLDSTTTNPLRVSNTNPIDSNPFAVPSHRTKRNATDSISHVSPNSCTNIDFKMIDERFVSGGELIIKNGQFGDYITAEVVDLLGIIPAPYRPVLCENYPTVARYVEKAWLPIDGEVTTYCLNTMPLTAKISQNLYLRVTYCATEEGVERQVVMNYHLTKKL